MEAVRLPTGNVTFLFTDIEGSTRRWEKHTQAMQEAVRLHDGILREAIAAHRGYVFKTIGDAFCAAFDGADSAVEAALEAQRRLAESDFATVGGLRVRMALHTGTADERDGDYFGPTLNRVARLLSIGHGGQVLLSRTTAQIVESRTAGMPSLVNLGSHLLKDLTEPEEVYQLVSAGLEQTFPELRSLRTATDNLPLDVTSFVGRTEQTSELLSMLASHRLVTVVGPGGIGKTRLTLHVARTVLEQTKEGVWFVELASTFDGSLISRLIASAIGQPLPDGDATTGLSVAIAKKPMLLVLDNCEHILEDAAKVAAALVRSCPNVRILASSRQPLGISAETLLRIATLDVPLPSESTRISAEAVARFDGVTLFVERARAANNRFALTDENVAQVADICRRLDGIPLALELAAARLRVLSIGQLHAMLDQRFRVLVGGPRDATSRQQTLEAAINWSYELLDERERMLFRRCGTFVDSFTPFGARTVDGDARVSENDIFELLYSLAEKSLIVADSGSDETRFRLLESMRAYALDRMEELGESEAAALRHLDYVRAVAEAAHGEFMRTGSDAAYTRTLAVEISEVRAALDFALNSNNVAAGAALLAVIGRPWFRLGLTAEGIGYIEEFIPKLPASNAALLARLWTELGWMASTTFHSNRGYEAAAEAVRWARAAADPALLAWSLAYFAGVAARSRKFEEAERALAEAEALCGADASAGQRFTQSEIRAFLAFLQKDFDAASAALASHLALQQSIGDEAGAMSTIGGYAESEHARGATRHAIDLIRESLPSAQRLLGIEQHAMFLCNLGAYHLAVGEIEQGRETLAASIALLAPADPAAATVTMALEHSALALALGGALHAAAKLEGYCEAGFREIGFEREMTETTTHVRLMDMLSQHFAPAELDALLVEGSRLTPREAEALTASGLSAVGG